MEFYICGECGKFEHLGLVLDIQENCIINTICFNCKMIDSAVLVGTVTE